MSVSLTAFFDELQDLFVNGTLYKSYVAKFKTSDELRMIKTSGSIRSPLGSTEPALRDINHKRVSLIASFMDLTLKQSAYIYAELQFYDQVMANCANGEEVSRVDMAWINNDAEDCALAKSFKHYAAVLERDVANARLRDTGNALPAGPLVLVGPFVSPFSADTSMLFKKPVTSPEAALNSEVLRIKPGSVADWLQAVTSLDMSDHSDMDAVAEIDRRVMPNRGVLGVDNYVSWLPTDFDVNDDGSVAIRSYINNLYPIQYAGLYQAISNLFVKFVPLLEQVATDVLHPRRPRMVFNNKEWFVPDMHHPDAIIDMVKQGTPLPEKYQQFVTNSSAYRFGGQGNNTLCVNGTELDMTAMYEAWENEMAAAKPATLPFKTPDRPIEAYSVSGMSLQASVEMVTIMLTPENPTEREGNWRAVGRAEECIFAVGLYFYDVENISRAPIKFRDPVSGKVFNNANEMEKFCTAFDVNGDAAQERSYSQEVGEIGIRTGRYMCFPNMYQTKLPMFNLADKTMPGHVKYIAFYIVNPATKLVSTDIVPPQQHNWVGASTKVNSRIEEELKLAHRNCTQTVDQRFDVCLSVRND